MVGGFGGCDGVDMVEVTPGSDTPDRRVPSDTSVAGRVAIVTGAGRGLGATIARDLRDAGATVVGVDLDGADLDADVGTAAGNQAMVDETLRRHGRLDILVLNAGVQHVAPLGSFAEHEWDRLQDVMLKGPFLALRSAWPALAESRGRVVVVSSTSGVAAEPRKAGYVSAKAGVLGLVRAAAVEGGALGIAVNAVAPGWMRTPMAERQLAEVIASGLDEEAALEQFLARQPIRRFVETEEVAAVVRFLASGAASGVTGVCLPVDLGLLAW